MIRLLNIFEKITNKFYWILRPFFSEEFLVKWKPIHLCWLYTKHNRPIPKYFIGMVNSPSVLTDSVTSITDTSALATGTIQTNNDTAANTTQGFVYLQGTSGDPTISDSVVTNGDNISTGTYSSTIPDLTSDTTYRLAAYATNGAGTAYGATIQFTTTGGATSIQQIKRYDGSQWQAHFLKRYTGTEWVTPVIKVWTGSEWKIVQEP